MKMDEKRKLLREAGWRRTDRAVGGRPLELWVRPGAKSGYQFLPVSLRAAWDCYRRLQGDNADEE